MNSLGIDVSKYNGLVNWLVGYANGVRFAGIRATISWGYKDPFLVSNLSAAQVSGIYRMPYHVLYPGESVSRQVDNFMQACAGVDWAHAAPVLDLELTHNQSKTQITTAAVGWLERVEALTGRKPIIYSRAQWINLYTVKDMWRTRYDWWLASYLYDRTVERPAPPTLPSGALTWLIHQNSDKRLAWPGFAAEGFIQTCDINRWNGDDAAVELYFGGVVQPVPACPTCGRPY